MTTAVKMLDLWDPPAAAGDPIACVAATFAFEPDFFNDQCIGRFLRLDWRQGEGDDLAYLIAQEERLAEANVSVLVDRSFSAEGRSLRWDLLPIAVSGGVMHAKVVLLLWEHHLRCVVGSANITRAGYREQVETATVLEAYDGSNVPRPVFHDLIREVARVADLAPVDGGDQGPHRRCDESLERMRAFISGVDVPDRSRRGDPTVVIVPARPGTPALPALAAAIGGTPRRATVLSPFFDKDDKHSPAGEALFDCLAQRGERSCAFAVSVAHPEGDPVVKAPKALRATATGPLRLEFREFRQPDEHEVRRLHAKAIVLETADRVAALVGSSNFTAAGLGLGAAGNLEVNVAICARRSADVGKALLTLVPMGTELDLEAVRWEAEEDDEREMAAELPRGFVNCLLVRLPAGGLGLRLSLDLGVLPDRWEIASPSGEILLNQSAATSSGTIEVPIHKPLLFADVRWWDADGHHSWGWVVNVADPATLPPAEELRHLPVQALLAALASTRPLPDALAAEIVKARQRHTVHDAELDPLRRFSDSGQLLARTRRLSLGLEGLQRRLERPAASLDAVKFRLHGPFGPVQIAADLLESMEASGGALAGEANFLLAEVALTVSRVDWDSTARLLDAANGDASDAVRTEAAKAIAAIEQLCQGNKTDPALAKYVGRAFKEARR